MSTEAADAVVIGGGAIGASTAFHLASLGLKRVVLCERRTLAAEATGKSAAHIQVGEAPEAIARVTLASLPYYLHWDDLVGAGSCGFDQTGYLRLCRSEDLEHSRQRVDAARAMGLDARILDPAELRELAPYLETDDISYAHYQPLAGHASSTGTTFGFAERAATLGAGIREQTSVREIEVSGSRVVGVRTSAGSIATPIVVIAAGAWTAALVGRLGLELPVTLVRTQVAVFSWPASATPIRFMSVNNAVGTYFYFSHEGPDARHIVVGPLRGPLPDLDGYSEEGAPDFAATARALLVGRVPGAAYLRPGGGWAGPITTTADGAPIIDAHPGVAGVFFATGCNGGGFKGSPAVGRALAEWATSGAPRVVDLRPFRADRFAARASPVASGIHDAK